MHKIVNGIRVELTSEEIAERQAEINTYNNGAFERQLEKLRKERNELLAETDFYALSDVTMTEAMTNYRQQLRDITEGLTTVEDVEAVTFPTKP